MIQFLCFTINKTFFFSTFDSISFVNQQCLLVSLERRAFGFLLVSVSFSYIPKKCSFVLL